MMMLMTRENIKNNTIRREGEKRVKYILEPITAALK